MMWNVQYRLHLGHDRRARTSIDKGDVDESGVDSAVDLVQVGQSVVSKAASRTRAAKLQTTTFHSQLTGQARLARSLIPALSRSALSLSERLSSDVHVQTPLSAPTSMYDQLPDRCL